MGEVPDDDAFAPLIAAHEDFVDKLTELEATLDEVMATREMREENGIIVDEALRFFEEELVPHLHLEDEAVLPRLEKAIGRHGTLVDVVAYEHAEIRREIEKFAIARGELNRDQNSWDKIQEMNRHGIFLVQFLWNHFRKENTSLFPTARRVLSAEETDELKKQLLAV